MTWSSAALSVVEATPSDKMVCWKGTQELSCAGGLATEKRLMHVHEHNADMPSCSQLANFLDMFVSAGLHVHA